MRLLKAQNTNLRNIYGKGVKYDVNDQVILDSTNAVFVPKGTTAQRPTTPINGHLRYNTDDDRFEVYEASAWYGVRIAAPSNSAPITQQNLGNGDATITIFGPLDSQDTNPLYTAPAAAQNVLVFVENVFQIATTNYTLEQNPSSTGTGQETDAGSFVTSTEYIITSTGDTDFTAVGAADSNVGTVFTATGAGTGTGKARETGYYLEFTSAPDLAKPVTVLHNFDK
jgi:hypothetical protein